MTTKEIKNIIIDLLKKTALAVLEYELKEVKLVFPPSTEMGDLGFECFALAKKLGKKPAEIARQIAEKIQPNEIIEQITTVGPYVNFKIKRNILFKTILEEIIEKSEKFGNIEITRQGKIMVEYLSPNTNKPLHLGHLRNGALGMAIANILQAAGSEVIRANLVNDRGIHICKSMLAWQKWGEGQTPETTGEKGDHFVGRWYVRFSQEAQKNPGLEQEAQELLQKWEAADKDVLALWQTMNAWVYGGFEKTYQKFGLHFDVLYYESKTYQLGKEIIQGGLEKRVFQKTDKGSVVFPLPEDEFGLDKDNQPKKITLIRDDGTSVYITQDLGATVLKFKEQGVDQCIFVVGSEQKYHFRVLFKILDTLGYAWAKNCQHLSYGMVYLPEGKMKSREGTVVDADNLITQMEKLAQAEIEKRTPGENAGDKALKIANGAIKFYLLRIGAEQDIHFDPKASISFDGFTGPYCQYTYARAKSILRAAPEKWERQTFPYGLLGNESELLLAQKLMAFPDVLQTAADTLNPSKIANFVYELCQTFNQFYQKYPVLKAENPDLTNARLLLVKAVSIIIKKSLNLLNIETLEQM